ncbi:hypothetical protein, partial [Microbispora sp. NPDC049125]|uniref:hypothetical protein n=1 Tax=Microbispora sp. NPDC049125 TaxID=3154929 RepID=UPI003465762F
MSEHPRTSGASREDASARIGSVGPTRRLVARVALLLLAGAALYQGLWAQFAPRSFYDGFPNGSARPPTSRTTNTLYGTWVARPTHGGS